MPRDGAVCRLTRIVLVRGEECRHLASGGVRKCDCIGLIMLFRYNYIWAPFISNINHAIGIVPILGIKPIQIEQLNEYSMFQTSSTTIFFRI